jgi:hypothetical protein
MIDMLKRHEIQVLRRAGHTLTEVAQLSGVSVRTVQRVVEEDAITTVDNAAERARLCSSCSAAIQSWDPSSAGWLTGGTPSFPPAPL